MSRIGKQKINVPQNVKFVIDKDNLVVIEGPKGRLEKKFSMKVKINIDNNEVAVARVDDSKEARALHGLSRTLINNMVIGVTEGFSKVLEIKGVGYRAAKAGNKLTLSLGYAHPVLMFDNDEIKTAVDGDKIIVSGINKEIVGQYAANIRAKKPPEPYKGKGIRYLGEKVRRKVGKTGKK